MRNGLIHAYYGVDHDRVWRSTNGWRSSGYGHATTHPILAP
ncbi:MAG: hypothetical protein ACYTJ0_01170 [Planctomycetota bacterium]